MPRPYPSSGSYSISRDNSIDRSLDHDIRQDVNSAEFERVRMRQLKEAEIRNVRAWVHSDSKAGVWTGALFAAWLTPAMLAWIWSGFGRVGSGAHGFLDWLSASIGCIGVLGVAWLLVVLARAHRLDAEWRRNVLRLTACAAAGSVSLCMAFEVLGPESTLLSPISGVIPLISLLPLLEGGVLGLAIARIGRGRNGTDAARWGGIVLLGMFPLFLYPGLDSWPWLLLLLLAVGAIGLVRGGFALWNYYEYRLVGGGSRD